MSKPEDLAGGKNSSALGLLARLFWMLIGNAILVISGVSILHNEKGFHIADAIFWITVAILIPVRYLDIKLWEGGTSTGRPATMTDWRRYAVMLLGIGGGIWLILHLVTYIASTPK
jgi:hypothetical protein